MGKSIKRRLIVGVAAGALLLSIAVGFSQDASAETTSSAHRTNGIGWCRAC